MRIKKDKILQIILDVMDDYNMPRNFTPDLFAVDQGLYGAGEDEYVDPNSPMDDEEWEINSSDAYDAEKVIDKFCKKGLTIDDLEEHEFWWNGLRAYTICVAKMYMDKDDAEEFAENEAFADELFEEIAGLIEG